MADVAFLDDNFVERPWRTTKNRLTSNDPEESVVVRANIILPIRPPRPHPNEVTSSKHDLDPPNLHCLTDTATIS